LSTSTYSLPSGLSPRANFSWTFAGNVLYAGTQWGLLVLLTKLFEPELFGRYALALSIVTPIFTASALQLRAVQVSAVGDESSFADYLLLRLVTNLLALLLLVLLVMPGLIPSHLFFLTLLLGCNQAIALVKDVYQGVMQKRERMDLVSISKILQGGASTAAAIVIAFLTHNILLVVWGMLIARFFALLIYDIPCARALAADFEPLLTRPAVRRALSLSRLFSLARIAFPLGIVTLLISLHKNIPRYFLADFGEAAVGYFAAIASLMSLQELVIGALGQSAVRRLALSYATDRKDYVRLLGRLTAIGVAVGMAGVLLVVAFGRPLLTILFREEYADFVDVFIWLIVARLVLNAQSFIGYGMTAARMFSVQVWMYGLMVISLFVSAWLLIPTWAGLGAAWAMLISACVTLIAGTVVMKKKLGSKRVVYHG
jgi:O-antigen/teichoic acid export membrane protein